MRKLALVLTAFILAGFGAVAPASAPSAFAATAPKVAIIVGATHDSTAGYRANAERIYAEAIRYTPNVVRVYSPNATWSRVKAAVNGASVVVYLGHGNGWPSPYTFDPSYTTKDGFGLNYDVNGDGKLSDYEVKYYGEPSIRTLTPAPNAVVLLFHLCYASGNSEQGGVPPSLSVARQRADNFAAAFLRTRARAVIAIGHGDSQYYIRELFTSRQTIEDLWRNAPEFNDHVLSFASTRNPGRTVLLDPDSPSPSSFYRALTGQLDLRTEDITGAAFALTDTDPATFVVPGNASPLVDGASVYGSAESAAAGTDPIAAVQTTDRVRIDWRDGLTSLADRSPVFRIHVDGGVEGWMTGGSLTPRDISAPRVWGVEDGTGAFSPNDDGSQDTFPLSVSLSEPATWTIRITDRSGHERASASGEGSTAEMTWAPAAGSVPDGEYGWTIEASDAWGNGPLWDAGRIVVDTEAPILTAAETAGAVPVLSPNGDGYRDTASFAVSASEPGVILGGVRDAADGEIDTTSVAVAAASAVGTLTWDGRAADGDPAADGHYAVTIAAQDLAGNRSEPQVRPVDVYASLGRVASSKVIFFPQDGDALASATSFSFALLRPATVTWTVVDATGAVVRTIGSGVALGAGVQAFTWDGRDDLGRYVARGTYRTVVTATDGTVGATQSAAVIADAFRIVASDATPARRQRITVTATSAEGLHAAPRLSILQPGIAGWTVTMTRVSSGVYRATVTLKASSTGTLRLKVTGTDTGGKAQATTVGLPLH